MWIWTALLVVWLLTSQHLWRQCLKHKRDPTRPFRIRDQFVHGALTEEGERRRHQAVFVTYGGLVAYGVLRWALT
jgi:hypothetical protein